jgi:hypothetical protein
MASDLAVLRSGYSFRWRWVRIPNPNRTSRWSRWAVTAIIIPTGRSWSSRWQRHRSRPIGTKAEVYSEGGIAEYWIVDTIHALVEVRSDIVDGGYTRVTPCCRGQALAPGAFPDLSLSVSDLLG